MAATQGTQLKRAPKETCYYISPKLAKLVEIAACVCAGFRTLNPETGFLNECGKPVNILRVILSHVHGLRKFLT